MLTFIDSQLVNNCIDLDIILFFRLNYEASIDINKLITLICVHCTTRWIIFGLSSLCNEGIVFGLFSLYHEWGRLLFVFTVPRGGLYLVCLHCATRGLSLFMFTVSRGGLSLVCLHCTTSWIVFGLSSLNHEGHVYGLCSLNQ